MNKKKLIKELWENLYRHKEKFNLKEYRELVAGLLFYKHLSEREQTYLDSMKVLPDAFDALAGDLQKFLGYFIVPCDLFSTWITRGDHIKKQDVITALQAFDRSLRASCSAAFSGIFDGLQKVLTYNKIEASDLQSILRIIDTIPSKADYDLLGFIYESLNTNFARNFSSIKGLGEFYTPDGVAKLIASIVCQEIDNPGEVSIYDPTCGSGSLLVKAIEHISKKTREAAKIDAFAQDIKEAATAMTKMNLAIHGIGLERIHAATVDTLSPDGLVVDNESKQPSQFDIVVSNPPYSQKWLRPTTRDPRFDDFVLAPKSCADYAFLLHGLYCLKESGVMAIILPHGALFRNHAEGEIRKRLVEINAIDAIIGLPANLFFGTNISTIIILLRKNRTQKDILFVDASRCFERCGNFNRLREADIKKIADAVQDRADIERFCKRVSVEEVKSAGYNLNIARYIQSREKEPASDLHALIFGGIPKAEIAQLDYYWLRFPTLKHELLTQDNGYTHKLKHETIARMLAAIYQNEEVKRYIDKTQRIFEEFLDMLATEAAKARPNEDPLTHLNCLEDHRILSSDLFERLEESPLVNRFDAYQVLMQALEIEDEPPSEIIGFLRERFSALPDEVFYKLADKLIQKAARYDNPLLEIEAETSKTQSEIRSLLGELTGEASDMLALDALENIFKVP